MGNYLWKSTTTPPDLGNLANWRLTDTSNGAVDLGPATVLPGPADTAYINTGSVPGSTTVGVCNAGTVITYAWYGAPVVIGGGTFSGTVYADYGTSGGVFNGNVRTINAMGPYATTGGTYNADLITLNFSSGIVVNGRISLNGGSSWLYSPNSAAVAPAASVKQGVSNLGILGTLKAVATRVIGGLGVA